MVSYTIPPSTFKCLKSRVNKSSYYPYLMWEWIVDWMKCLVDGKEEGKFGSPPLAQNIRSFNADNMQTSSQRKTKINNHNVHCAGTLVLGRQTTFNSWAIIDIHLDRGSPIDSPLSVPSLTMWEVINTGITREPPSRNVTTVTQHGPCSQHSGLMYS